MEPTDFSGLDDLAAARISCASRRARGHCTKPQRSLCTPDMFCERQCGIGRPAGQMLQGTTLASTAHTLCCIDSAASTCMLLHCCAKLASACWLQQRRRTRWKLYDHAEEDVRTTGTNAGTPTAALMLRIVMSPATMTPDRLSRLWLAQPNATVKTACRWCAPMSKD